MGNRFEKTLETYALGDLFAVTKEGTACLILSTGNTRQLNVYRFDPSEIYHTQFVTEFQYTYSKWFVQIRELNSIIYVYAANDEGNIYKGSLSPTNSQTNEQFTSSSVIKAIDDHPNKDSFAILNDQGLVLVEQNYTLPFSYPSGKITSGRLKIEELLDGSVNYYVAMLTGELNTKAYLEVAKIGEESYLSSYGNQTGSQNTIGVWHGTDTFEIDSIHFFRKNRILVIRIEEDSEIDTSYNLFFNQNGQRIAVSSDLEFAQQVNMAEESNWIVYKTSYNNICSGEYSSTSTSLAIDQSTQNCFYSTRTVEEDPIQIENEKYVVLSDYSSFYPYNWSIQEEQTGYAVDASMGTISTRNPDSLILKYGDYLSLHEIVPLSTGGIVGIVFGSIFGCCLLVCIVCVIASKCRP